MKTQFAVRYSLFARPIRTKQLLAKSEKRMAKSVIANG